MASLHHFLDANILIGSRIEWDLQHHHAHRYMRQDGFRRHTSERVYNECYRAFSTFRRVIAKYLNYFGKNLPPNPDPYRLDAIIRKITGQCARSLRDEKEKNVLRSFVQRNMDELRNCILGTEYERDTFKKDVIAAIKGALDSLDLDCRPDDHSAPVICHTCCPENYDSHLMDEMSALTSVIGHQPDILVMLDAYFIQVHRLREVVSFVTTDKTHILNNREKIEGILPNIVIREPGSFLIGHAQ